MSSQHRLRRRLRPHQPTTRTHEAVVRICWGIALFNIVIFGHALLEFAAR